MNQPISETQKQLLLNLALEKGVDDLARHLVKLARPCVALAASGPELSAKVGASRLGGLPDIAPGFEWPSQMAFLMQLNMADVGPLDATGKLPATGMLYFFLGDDESRVPAHRIIYRDTPVTELSKAVTPKGYFPLGDDRCDEGNTNVIYHAFELAAQSSISLPSYGSRDFAAIGEVLESQGDRTGRYFEIQEALCIPRASKKVGQHQMLGYPVCSDRDADVAACFAAHGLDPDLYYYDKAKLLELIAELNDDSAPGNIIPLPVTHRAHLLEKRRRQLTMWENNPAKIEDAHNAVDQWVTLLDLDSDLNVGMCFWDAGRVQFLMHRDDLVKRQFERTSARLISS